ncbi:MAG: hypothetical protein EXR35_00970 [Limnohabitans sp.]|nr:hypothetical protein [Limnohabitans sp.]
MYGEPFNKIEKETCDWDIRVHPYRIRADIINAGLTTPEGLHRDGVDYITIMIIDRFNVTGGEVIITDANENLLASHSLTESLEVLIANDRETMHSASPIKPIVADNSPYRGVLITAYTKHTPTFA